MTVKVPASEYKYLPEIDRMTISATKYFMRTERGRGKWQRALEFLLNNFGPDFYKIVSEITLKLSSKDPEKFVKSFFPPFEALKDYEIHFDTWLADLYNSKEGYDKIVRMSLSLRSPEVDKCWRNRKYGEGLRKHRNRIYHFDLDYYEPSRIALFSTSESLIWANELQDALHYFYDKHSRELNKKYNISDAVMDYAERIAELEKASILKRPQIDRD